MGFFSKIVDSLKNASRSRFELNKETNSVQLLLDTKDENYFTLEFDTMEVDSLYDPSIQTAYNITGTSKTLGRLHIESIRLKPLHHWNCSAGSAYEEFLKLQFNKDQIQYIDSYDNKFIKFTKYQKDFENEIGLIWFSLNYIEVFILDPKGKLFNDLLEIYNINNQELFIKDTESEIDLKIQGSLTQKNLIDNYFSKGD